MSQKNSKNLMTSSWNRIFYNACFENRLSKFWKIYIENVITNILNETFVKYSE